MRQVNLRLPDDLVDAIDRVRNGVPRDRLLRAIAMRWFTYHRDDNARTALDYILEVEDGYTLDAGVLRVMRDAVVVFDAAQRVRLWNEGAERTFGYAASEAMDQPAYDLLPSVDGRRVELERLRAVIGEGHWRGVGAWWPKSGTPVQCEAVAQSLRDAKHELRGFVVSFREVIEKQSE